MQNSTGDGSAGAGPPPQPDQAALEREALGRVAHALRHYRSGAGLEVARWQHNLNQLGERHRALVPQLPEKIAAARQCIYRNHLFLSSLLAMFEEDSGWAPPHLAPANAAADEYEDGVGAAVAPQDHEKVRYVLKNCARDWSAEGAAEREQSYGRITAELRRLFASWPADAPEPPSVLVPGAGLGRLCLEIVNMGFQAQGNEFSYFMLLASAYLLNGIERPEQWTIHPWCHQSCNQPSVADQLRGVSIPDVHPAELVAGPGLLSMSAGDFAEVYAAPEYAEAFDAVACCFFLDTAHNVLEYLEVIWHTLRPGCYFVNLGPLLYHWADAHMYLEGEELSVELSLEEVKAAAARVGFKLLRDEMVTAAFLRNERSMMQSSTYNCAFWTMQKVDRAAAAAASAPAAGAAAGQQPAST
ncbi:UPF0586 C9orf41 [Chlorella sorokiniana]|uniref:carnosine N-methyltransferase n=1 Tax=Chlorella sorokiniana TaxID=3076 RepID=A0A2P6TY63_CHLSO|nr:UPF0586 C9orf41 [Chlorella sorokiniana]|eukprot:PRW58988.1 UPF0586 C9orf41 [Chlorella sorokiniana]